ncbi:MAG TPA: amidase, partial [Acidimicrobiales bacterium]|nr:amidase [Acidimicrobiales bacterium]
MDFRQETVLGLASQVREGVVGARELVQLALDRITKVNERVNAFVALDAQGALAAARSVDDRVARGEEVGTLPGIPIGVKDLEDAAGLPTTQGSAALPHSGIAHRDSILVARLKAQGCIVVGKTNTPELGHYADTVSPLFGATRNPWDLACSPGGSSGGSAAAIAAGMVPLATGSDGGGSIRIPSSLCGLSG